MISSFSLVSRQTQTKSLSKLLLKASIGFGKITDLKNLSKAQNTNQEFDFFVIGGGSGGLAASKEAAQLGAKVGLADFVAPSPVGTKWGLGGTCVNVGCIPKKLMHYAAGYGESYERHQIAGWKINPTEIKHDWNQLVERVQENVKRTNFGYRVALRDNKVEYFNAKAEFIDKHTLTLNSANKSTPPIQIKAKNILLSPGGRPKFLDHVDKSLVITSDDLFSLTKPPGKTLIVGASYIALECAGFLNGLGYDVTVLYRSQVLREFDSQVAEKLQAFMTHHGVKFVRSEVKNLQKQGEDQRLVSFTDSAIPDEVFDTVLLAIGRVPNTHDIGIDKIGVKTHKSSTKVIADDLDKTSVDNVYAIGDAVQGRMELTPVAIKAGKHLAQRLFNKGNESVDYSIVPTTIFTPLEYSSIGLTEAQAVKKYSEENVQSYVSKFKPLEWVLSEKDSASRSFIKLIVNKNDDERVIGLHYLGPQAAEVAQGFAVAMQMGAKKKDFDKTIAIHPSSAEELVLLKQIKGVSETDEWLCCG